MSIRSDSVVFLLEVLFRSYLKIVLMFSVMMPPHLKVTGVHVMFRSQILKNFVMKLVLSETNLQNSLPLHF